jgi:proteasome-associated ATPase
MTEPTTPTPTPRRGRRNKYTELLDDGPRALSIEDRMALASNLRSTSPEQSGEIDQVLFMELGRLRKGLKDSQNALGEVGEILDKLTAPPWHTARFVECVEQDGWCRALVFSSGSLRLVDFGPDVDAESAYPGDSVFLGAEQNVLLAIATGNIQPGGETARFERVTADGMLVIRHRDEELIVSAARGIDVAALEVGNELRYDRAAQMALERVDSGGAQEYLVEEPLKVGPKAVGGQANCLEQVFDALSSSIQRPDLASEYGLSSRCSVLLCGPPGCGKTLIARVAANMLDQLSDRSCRFFSIKPGQLESPWVGETQQNIRNAFKDIRKAARGGIAVVFIDEVETIGRHRGTGQAQHADLFTAAWLAELDGFDDRGDIAIVSATNRVDLIDTALLERLSDTQITVSRPDIDGARAIFGVHMAETVPVFPNGALAESTREELIETGVSSLFAPNGESPLCVLHFRDGSTRSVGAYELVSGRLIEQLCRAACTRALAREIRGGSKGVRVSDVRSAVSQATERLATTITRGNAHHYIADLPDDIDVVRVERPSRPVKRMQTYLNLEL